MTVVGGTEEGVWKEGEREEKVSEFQSVLGGSQTFIRMERTAGCFFEGGDTESPESPSDDPKRPGSSWRGLSSGQDI